MFRTAEQIVDALHAGRTTLKSMRNSVSRYRKLGNLVCVIMYMTAIETYLHEVKMKEVCNRQIIP